MDSFDFIWQLLNPQAQYANRKRACYEMWQSFSEDKREHISRVIKDKLAKGKFVDYNPYFAIKRNSQEQVQMQTLSFNEYYNRFGTTEERDGWKMVKPQKAGDPPVYYVKSERS